MTPRGPVGLAVSLVAAAICLGGTIERPAPPAPACYPAELERVVDGDTIQAVLQVRTETASLGVSCVTELRERVRIADVRAPELTGPEAPAGRVARAWLEARLEEAERASRAGHCWEAACPEALEVCPRLDRQGHAVRSLGRLVAEVRAGGEVLADELVAAGVARYGTKEGW